MLPTMLGIRTRRNLHIWTQNIFNYTGDAQWSNEQVFFEAPGYLRWPGVVVKPLGGSSAFRSLPALGWPPTSVCFHGRHSECPNVSVVPLICKALVHVLDVPNLNTFVFVIHSGLSLLAKYFQRKTRSTDGAVSQLILTRVAACWIAERGAIQLHVGRCPWQSSFTCSYRLCMDLRCEELPKPENRKAPVGHHSEVPNLLVRCSTSMTINKDPRCARDVGSNFKRLMLQEFQTQRSHPCLKTETSPAHRGALTCKVAPLYTSHAPLYSKQ